MPPWKESAHSRDDDEIELRNASFKVIIRPKPDEES